MTPRTAVLAGASGLVGSHLLQQLRDDASFARVTAPVRRPLGLTHPKLVEALVDFDHPDTLRPHLAVDSVFCTLGTTIKEAGSREAFRQVDYTYPLTLAKLAAAAGAKQFLIVTSVGAAARSWAFYTRVKGELEEALHMLSFPEGLHVFHPSMILGERPDHRRAERVVGVIMRATTAIMAGPLVRYRAIEAADLAWAMRSASKQVSPGVYVYEGKALFALASE